MPQPNYTEAELLVIQNTAKILFFRKEPLKVISTTIGVPIGTISSWANRLGWKKAREEVFEALTAGEPVDGVEDKALTPKKAYVQNVQKKAAQIANRSSATIAEMRDEYVHVVGGKALKVAKHVAKLPNDKALAVAKAANAWDTMGRRNLGLEDNRQAAGPTIVNIHMLSHLPDLPVIEAEPVPVVDTEILEDAYGPTSDHQDEFDDENSGGDPEED